jgi:hypothetical protein
MTAALEGLKEIERLATEEVEQPGTNEDRFRALRRILATAKAFIAKAEAQP